MRDLEGQIRAYMLQKTLIDGYMEKFMEKHCEKHRINYKHMEVDFIEERSEGFVVKFRLVINDGLMATMRSEYYTFNLSQIKREMEENNVYEIAK